MFVYAHVQSSGHSMVMHFWNGAIDRDPDPQSQSMGLNSPQLTSPWFLALGLVMVVTVVTGLNDKLYYTRAAVPQMSQMSTSGSPQTLFLFKVGRTRINEAIGVFGSFRGRLGSLGTLGRWHREASNMPTQDYI